MFSIHIMLKYIVYYFCLTWPWAGSGLVVSDLGFLMVNLNDVGSVLVSATTVSLRMAVTQMFLQGDSPCAL